MAARPLSKPTLHWSQQCAHQTFTMAVAALLTPILLELPTPPLPHRSYIPPLLHRSASHPAVGCRVYGQKHTRELANNYTQCMLTRLSIADSWHQSVMKACGQSRTPWRSSIGKHFHAVRHRVLRHLAQRSSDSLPGTSAQARRTQPIHCPRHPRLFPWASYRPRRLAQRRLAQRRLAQRRLAQRRR